MKLGEIKIEALMMMFPGKELEVDVSNDSELRDKISQLSEDSNYSDLLSAMPGAINRCFASLESKGVVPTKSYELDAKKAKKRGARLLFDLSGIEDLGAIERVALYSEYYDNDRCDYTHETDTAILLDSKDGQYVVIYNPVLPRITMITDEAREIKLPRDVLDLIPYFVKSELLRAENEQEASVARNVYEQMSNELKLKRQGHQTAVESIYEVPR